MIARTVAGDATDGIKRPQWLLRFANR